MRRPSTCCLSTRRGSSRTTCSIGSPALPQWWSGSATSVSSRHQDRAQPLAQPPRLCNPYRAWPTDYDNDARTWSAEFPAVWRPTAAQLQLWRALYPEWKEPNCVAAPGDRAIALEGLKGLAAQVWKQVAEGLPVLLEVDGLEGGRGGRRRPAADGVRGTPPR